MTVLGVFLLLFGVGFVGVALVLLKRRSSDRRLLRRLRSAARPTLDHLSGSLVLSGSVLVTGLTGVGPEGLLTSPAYRTDCVWYETEVTSDSDDTERRHLKRRAGGDFLVLTDGTGSIRFPADPIEPRGLLSESQTLTKGQKAAAGSGLARLDADGLLPPETYPWLGTRTLDVRETTVGIGVPVSVLGRPRATPDGIVIGRRGVAVSTETPDAWMSRLERSAAETGQSAMALPLVGVALGALGAVMIVIS